MTSVYRVKHNHIDKYWLKIPNKFVINVGFWNIGNRNNALLLVELLFHHSLNVLALAEYGNSNISDVIQNINHITKRNYREVNLRSRLTLLVDDEVTNIELKQESNYYSILSLKFSNKFEIVMALVHLSSKLHSNDEDYIIATQEISDSLAQQEIQIGNCKSIILGDFNLDPYESTVVGAHALHAISDRKIASKISRKIKDKPYSFFYNPMWAHFADGSGNASGTYFYYSSKMHAPFWHIFDQVLLRPSLLTNFNDKTLVVIKKINAKSLISANGRPIKKISDHLPIKFSLNY